MRNSLILFFSLIFLGTSMNSCIQESDFLNNTSLENDVLSHDLKVTAKARPQNPNNGTGTFVLLEVLPGAQKGSAIGINNHGEIVGYSEISGYQRPTYWNNSQSAPEDLGLPQEVSYARATSISDNGHIVGASYIIQSSDYAIQFRPGTPAVLEGLVGYGLEYAWEVNNFGLISGSTYNTPGIKASYAKGIYWNNGQINEIGKFENEAWTVAYGINDAGTIVGYSRISGAVNTPFYWDDGSFTALPFMNQGIGTQKAYDININGLIAGACQDANGIIHPVIWQNGQLIDLGIIPGSVNGGWAELMAVNDNGDAVGWAYGMDGRQHAILYKDGKITQLSEPQNAFITKAYDINDAGQVVGDTYFFDGSTYQLQPVLWTTDSRGGGKPNGGGKKN